jgi:hypothetical protein
MTNTTSNIGCLGLLLKAFGLLPKENNTSIFPYAQRDDFLSSSEFSFYKVLVQAINKELVVCPKVGLQDIFFVTERDQSKKASYLNKINRKHIDFLICNKETMKPVFGIELDDLSHQRQDRVDRDIFVDQLFKVAGLRLIRINNKKSYSINEIAELCKITVEVIQSDQLEHEMDLKETKTSSEILISNVPICKKCGHPMVIRTSSKGEQTGKSFYGCSNFPRCRETVEII